MRKKTYKLVVTPQKVFLSFEKLNSRQDGDCQKEADRDTRQDEEEEEEDWKNQEGETVKYFRTLDRKRFGNVKTSSLNSPQALRSVCTAC